MIDHVGSVFFEVAGPAVHAFDYEAQWLLEPSIVRHVMKFASILRDPVAFGIHGDADQLLAVYPLVVNQPDVGLFALRLLDTQLLLVLTKVQMLVLDLALIPMLVLDSALRVSLVFGVVFLCYGSMQVIVIEIVVEVGFPYLVVVILVYEHSFASRVQVVALVLLSYVCLLDLSGGAKVLPDRATEGD